MTKGPRQEAEEYLEKHNIRALLKVVVDLMIFYSKHLDDRSLWFFPTFPVSSDLKAKKL
jgi:hypothetical protein